MSIKGEMLIGGGHVLGTNGVIEAIDAHTGAVLGPAFGGAASAELERACALADSAFNPYRETSPEARAAFLLTIAQNILDIGDALIVRCMAETGLSRARLEGERMRTVNQLRLFASVVVDGTYLDVRIDPALPERKPLPRPDLRLRQIPLGPVAVFGASNFPLAFSVAGGDTASALAAGCPVVVKAHSAHLGTSELIGQAIQAAVQSCGMPEGTFSLLFDSGRAIGQGLVADSRIKAVGFTGSRGGGTALLRIAAARAEPIPVYAEMSSINPVLLFPGALVDRATEIGKNFAAALAMGAGQFCTNPGLVIAIEGEGLDVFTQAVKSAVAEIPAATMLTPGIHKAYQQAMVRMSDHVAVATVARGLAGEQFQCQAGVFSTTAAAFLASRELHEEIFGAASLVVRCANVQDMHRVIEALEGQLTAALHLGSSDIDLAKSFIPLLERKVGRILVNGFGTGVEVAQAMVHGGPYPSTSDGRSTSVGSLAIARFMRPVCYQDVPDALLPAVLNAANPYRTPRRIDRNLEV